MMKTDLLLEKIRFWAEERNLHTADPKAQLCKLLEEVGELASGLNRNNLDLIKDSIGDTIVVLQILCLQLSLDFNECLQLAYNEIKDRKGKMIDGVFVKESDL